MANERARIGLYVMLSLIGLISIGVFMRWLVIKKRFLRRIKLQDNWIFLTVFVLTFIAFVLYGVAGGASMARYSDDIESTCLVTDYEEQETKIRVKVDIINDIPIYGRAKWKCSQSIHNFDLEKYEECVADLKNKRPIGAIFKCWYNKNKNIGSADTYLIYWSKRKVENYWLIFGLLSGVFLVEIFIGYGVPPLSDFIDKRFPHYESIV